MLLFSPDVKIGDRVRASADIECVGPVFPIIVPTGTGGTIVEAGETTILVLWDSFGSEGKQRANFTARVGPKANIFIDV